MIANKPFKATALALLFLAIAANAHGALTGLSDAPLVTSSTTDVLPNVMFMLDDSGSMDWDYMPDDAKNFSGKYGFNSSQCNGTYYNPNITYAPPINSTGAPLNATATSFTAAYKDGYNTAAGTVNLSTGFTGGSGSGSSGINLTPGPAFYYTYTGTQTTAAQMDFHNPASTFYKECISAIGATPGSPLFNKVRLATTPTTTITVASSGGGATITVSGSSSTTVSNITVNGAEILTATTSGSNQSNNVASRIASKINACTAAATGNCTVAGYAATISPTNSSQVIITGPSAAAGFLPIITKSGTMAFATTVFPTVTSTAVSGITVNGVQLLLSGSTASTTSNTALATSVAAGINAAGYSATASGNIVTITGPASASTYTPVITTVPASGGMTLTTDAFPESTPARLQNFANWYSYYSNRMLMMKTGAGQAFAPISDKYRVGFLTMNNNVSPDFVENAPFNAAQRSAWYTKLYGAKPGNSTPLREALSHVGQYYAHEFGTFTTYSTTLTVGGSGSTTVDSITVNGVEIMFDVSTASTSTSTVAANIAAQINLLDPSDYGASVSGNVITITGLSTANGVTPIITKSGSMTVTAPAFTSTTTTAQLNGITPADPMQYSCQQNFVILSTDGYWNGSTTYNLANGTVGQQDGAEPRPYNDGATQLQSTSQLQQSQTQVFQSTNQNVSRTLQIQSSTSNLQSQTSQLQQDVGTLQSQTSQLQEQISRLTTQTSQLQIKGTNSKKLQQTSQLQATTQRFRKCTTLGSGSSGWGTCTDITFNCSGGTSDTAAPYCRASSTINTTGVSSCTVGSTTNPATTACNTVVTAAYAPVTSCTANATPSSSGNTTQCVNTNIWVGTSTCSAGTNNSCQTVVTSAYAPAASCTANATPDSSGNTTQCSTTITSAYAGAPSCTATVVPDVNGYTTQCRYWDNTAAATWSAWANASSCTPVAQNSGPSYTAGTAVQCQYSWATAQGTPSCSAPAYVAGNYSNATVYRNCQTVVTSPYANIGSCTVNAVPDGSGNTTQCQYTAYSAYANASSCTPAAQSAGSPYSGPAVQCQTLYNGNATDCAAAGTVNIGGVCYAGIGSLCTASGPTGGQTVTCLSPNNPVTTGPTAVASCAPASAGSGNYYMQTSCSAPITVPGTLTLGVASCTPGTGAGPAFITTNCNTVTTGPSSVGGCTAAVASASNNYTTTTCAAGSGGVANTLADVAEYYYVTDLRTDALGNCTGAVVPPAAVGNQICTTAVPDPRNDVPSSGLDAATHQHMTTFTLGLGARGKMVYSPSYLTDNSGDFFAVKNGSTANGTICSWQTTPYGACNWPIPGSSKIENIDDLWHAAVNGRGNYFSATDPASLVTSLSSALAGVSARTGASAAATTSNPNVTSGDNFVFSSTFTTSSWYGELIRQQLDLSTGVTSSTVDWAAKDKLDTKAALTAKAASRTIYTYSAGAANHLQAFNETNFGANSNFKIPHISTSPDGLTQMLCASPTICASGPWQASRLYLANERFVNAGVVYQVTTGYTSGATFGATDTTNSSIVASPGNDLVNFLRGDRSNEGAETDNTKLYRQRTSVLGDIVNAEAVYVKAPLFNYNDAGYSDFVATQAARQGIVYAAGNDGMLHAFYAADGGVGIVGGDEAWAYIPSLMLPDLYKLADKEYATKHKYFVDGTPVVGDICPTAPTTACTGLSAAPAVPNAQWRTILVGGLNKGGRGYYAMDVTDPASPKALWEFTDTNLGYTYGNPKIAKLKNGRWVVMVTSGYNNVPGTPTASDLGDGVGRLYLLDAFTGIPIASINGTGSISTGVGDTTTPSGLARIAVRVTDATTDNTALAIYGGDLLGNLWRFDVNSDIAAATYDATKDYGAAGFDAQLLTTLRGPTGLVQPITAKPELGDVSGNKVIYVGTGSYLGAGDIGDTSTQSIYAIKDPLAVGTVASTAIYDSPRTIFAAAWQATHAYAPNDMFTNAGVGYQVTTAYISGATFGATDTANSSVGASFKNQTPTNTTCPSGSPSTICTAGQSVRTSPNLVVSFATDAGWFMDLPDLGERANTDPTLSLGTLGFTTNVPNSSVCTVGGYSFRYFMDYRTGGAVSTSTTAVVSTKLGNALATRPVYVRLPNGVVVELTRLSTGTTSTSQVPIGAGGAATRRTSWRELIQEQ